MSLRQEREPASVSDDSPVIGRNVRPDLRPSPGHRNVSDPPADGAWRIAGPAVPIAPVNPAWDPDVDAEYPPLALPKGGKGKGKQSNPKGKGKGRVSPPREPRHQNFSHRSGGRAQARPAPMREAPIKLKRAKNEAAGLSESFV